MWRVVWLLLYYNYDFWLWNIAFDMVSIWLSSRTKSQQNPQHRKTSYPAIKSKYISNTQKRHVKHHQILERSDVLMFIQFLSISAEEFVQEQENLIPPALGYSRHQGILKKQMRTHHLKPEKPYVNLFVQISWGAISINIFIIYACIYAHVNTYMYCI